MSSSNNPADFDALLDALGARDAEPPPLMKKLLAHLRPVVGDESNPRDMALLAELENWLAALTHDREQPT